MRVGFTNERYHSCNDVKDDTVMRLYHNKVLISLLTKLILSGNTTMTTLEMKR